MNSYTAGKAWVTTVFWTALALSQAAQARAQTPAPAETAAHEAAADAAEKDDLSGDPVAQATHLNREALVREVLARNPEIKAAHAQWRAARARTRTEGGLEDPMLRYGLAPISIFSGDRFGQTIEIEQRLPFPGKLGLAVEVAQAEADAAKESGRSAELGLAVAACTLYDEWYVVHRALAINDEHAAWLGELQRNLLARFTAGTASQADALAAEVAQLGLLREKVALEAQRERVRAELNRLLHRPPENALPEPPETLAITTETPPPSAVLRARALDALPNLRGAHAELRGRRAAIALADRSGYPDFAVMASYNSMWMDAPHQFMLGVAVSLPFHLDRQQAAGDQARAELAHSEWTLASEQDAASLDIEQARLRVIEALRTLDMLEGRLYPVAKAQVEAARVGVENGGTPLSAVVEAERNLRGIELEIEMARADVHRTRSELRGAVGEPPARIAKEGAP
jgi:outer membrane protein TolC